VARYGQRFKNEVVARLQPQENGKLNAISLEVGVS